MFLKYFIFAMTFLSACTPEPGNDRDYSNPHDSDSERNITEDSSSSSEHETCLNDGCGSSLDLAYDFKHQFKITPEDCQEVHGIKAFDDGVYMSYFLFVRCNGLNEIRFSMMSFDGFSLDNEVAVSDDCPGDISGFAVAKAVESYLLVYTCKMSEARHDTIISALRSDGAVIQEYAYESKNSIYPYQYLVEWNPESGFFGVARSGSFQRFDLEANPVGGALVLSNHPYSQMQVLDGSWVVLSNTNSYNSSCTRISSMATLQCNDVALGASTAGFFDSKTMLTGDFGSSSALSFSRSSFKVQNCSIETKSDNISVVNADPYASNNTIFQPIKLSSAIGGVLYKSKTNLVFALVALTGPFRIYHEISVVNFSELRHAHILVKQKNLYAVYAKDGDAYVSYTN